MRVSMLGAIRRAVDLFDLVFSQFSTYIRNYMKAYPHIPQEEYPTFDDFDMNRDGLVTFQEW